MQGSGFGAGDGNSLLYEAPKAEPVDPKKFLCVFACDEDKNLILLHVTNLPAEHQAALGILRQEHGKVMAASQTLHQLVDVLVHARLGQLATVLTRVEKLITIKPR